MFGGESKKTVFIKDEGFDVYPLYEPDPDLLFHNIRNGKIRFVDDHTLNMMINSDLGLFEKVTPDIVISDGRFSAMISTQIYGVKHVAIVNGSSTPYRAIPYFPIVKRHFADIYPPEDFLLKLINPITLKLEMFVFDNIMRIFKSLSNKYNIKHRVTATNCLCGVNLTLIADIPEFFPSKFLPQNYHYIGPVTWKPPKSKNPPEWWPIDKRNKKIAYITMGTTGEPELFQKIYNVFKDIENIICVITTGGQSDSIKSIPDKIYVTDYMDGDSVMEKADLVVCHGGNGTIYQALTFGIPIIGIPTIPDQNFNMRMVENINGGIRILSENILSNPGYLENKIKKIISDNFNLKRSLIHFKNRLKTINGAETGARIITDFIRNEL